MDIGWLATSRQTLADGDIPLPYFHCRGHDKRFDTKIGSNAWGHRSGAGSISKLVLHVCQGRIWHCLGRWCCPGSRRGLCRGPEYYPITRPITTYSSYDMVLRVFHVAERYRTAFINRLDVNVSKVTEKRPSEARRGGESPALH